MAARARRRVVPAVVLFALEFASVGSGCEVVTRPIVPGMRFDGTVFTMRMQLDPARGGRFLALGAPSFLFRPLAPLLALVQAAIFALRTVLSTGCGAITDSCQGVRPFSSQPPSSAQASSSVSVASPFPLFAEGGGHPHPPNRCCPPGRPERPCEYRTIVRSPPRVWTQELSPFLSGATRGRRNIHPGAPAAVITTHRPQQVAIVTVIPLWRERKEQGCASWWSLSGPYGGIGEKWWISGRRWMPE